MTRKNPLEIPEVALLVASYLTNKDLTSCLLVSKSWQDSFLPHRWQVIKASSEKGSSRPSWFGPSPLDIYRHRHLIYNLLFYGDPCWFEGFHFSNLRRLTLNCISSVHQDVEKSILLDLTEMFPLLVGLNLECVKLAAASWLSLSTHLHLKFLYLYRIEVKGGNVPRFWRACANLESLELGRVSIGCKSIPADMVFDRMRKLWVWEITEPDQAVQLDLILRCPRLEDLYWSLGDEDDAEPLPRLITHPIPSGHWPHLDILSIECNLQDTDLASILKVAGDGHGSLTFLGLIGCSLGVQTFRALGPHFNTLVHLDLEVCFTPTSPMFRDILCSCPKLEVLKARSVLAKDVAEGGPWCCQWLRELKICFWFGETEQDLQQLVFRHLSTLTRLESLTMYRPEYEHNRDGVLQFQLGCGLGHLAPLQQLTTLGFDTSSSRGHYVPQLGMEEVEWMVVHWEKLRCVRGILNGDPLEEDKLRRALQHHGIGMS